jgi:mannitol/fructose-specific phosphotransferase system IIA component (Ntr-type)
MTVGLFMRLSELLNEGSISLSLTARDKESCIKEMVQLLESSHGVNTKGEILSKVLQRESMMSTGIGNGVAIPHGKTRQLDHLVAACAVAPSGIDFDSMDGEPATLFILLSRLLKEEGVRAALRQSPSPQHFIQVLRDAESRFL